MINKIKIYKKYFKCCVCQVTCLLILLITIACTDDKYKENIAKNNITNNSYFDFSIENKNFEFAKMEIHEDQDNNNLNNDNVYNSIVSRLKYNNIILFSSITNANDLLTKMEFDLLPADQRNHYLFEVFPKYIKKAREDNDENLMNVLFNYIKESDIFNDVIKNCLIQTIAFKISEMSKKNKELRYTQFAKDLKFYVESEAEKADMINCMTWINIYYNRKLEEIEKFYKYLNVVLEFNKSEGSYSAYDSNRAIYLGSEYFILSMKEYTEKAMSIFENYKGIDVNLHGMLERLSEKLSPIGNIISYEVDVDDKITNVKLGLEDDPYINEGSDLVIEKLCEKAERDLEGFGNIDSDTINVIIGCDLFIKSATEKGTNRYIKFLESRIALTEDNQREKYKKVLDALRN